MIVVHIGLLSHYTDGMSYQDNSLAEMNAKEGHTVIFITDIHRYENGMLVETEEEDVVLNNGIRLIRLKYDNICNSFITNKIQKASKLKKLLEDIKPDSIMYHGVCGFELMDVAKYVKKNPGVLFYMDSHEDFNNTARNCISKVAYKYIHGLFVMKARKYVKKVLYITKETKEYLQEMYNFSEEELEFYPLGGIIQSKEKQLEDRKYLVKQLNLNEDVIICGHSGKLDKLKKTEDLLNAFNNINDERLVLIIWGMIPENQKKVLTPLIERDKRVFFLGWKNSEESTKLMNAVDLYCQPGSQSISSQAALCCGCAEMLFPHSSYTDFYKNIAYYVREKKDMEVIFRKILLNREGFNDKKEETIEFAKKNLAYSKLSERYLS